MPPVNHVRNGLYHMAIIRYPDLELTHDCRSQARLQLHKDGLLLPDKAVWVTPRDLKASGRGRTVTRYHTAVESVPVCICSVSWLCSSEP